MDKQKHIKRHVLLHKRFDELLADFLDNNRMKLPSNTTALELMQWSHKQTESPDETDLIRSKME